MELKPEPVLPAFKDLLEEFKEHPSGLEKRAAQAYEAATRPEPRSPALSVLQVMKSPVVSLSPDMNLADATRIMKHHDFRHLPVVNAGKLVGILSDRDLLKHGSESDTPVSSVMSKEPLTASPETLIRAAAQRMLEGKVSALPVLDNQDRLVGMITITDILRAIVEKAPIELWA